MHNMIPEFFFRELELLISFYHTFFNDSIQHGRMMNFLNQNFNDEKRAFIIALGKQYNNYYIPVSFI